MQFSCYILIVIITNGVSLTVATGDDSSTLLFLLVLRCRLLSSIKSIFVGKLEIGDGYDRSESHPIRGDIEIHFVLVASAQL